MRLTVFMYCPMILAAALYSGGCGLNSDPLFGPGGSGGSSGQAGSDGQGGSAGTGGEAGATGTGGTAGFGGMGGQGGSAGAGGEAGATGTGGTAGSGGMGGSSGQGGAGGMGGSGGAPPLQRPAAAQRGHFQVHELVLQGHPQQVGDDQQRGVVTRRLDVPGRYPTVLHPPQRRECCHGVGQRPREQQQYPGGFPGFVPSLVFGQVRPDVQSGARSRSLADGSGTLHVRIQHHRVRFQSQHQPLGTFLHPWSGFPAPVLGLAPDELP